MRVIGDGRYELAHTVDQDGSGLLWSAKQTGQGWPVAVRELIPPEHLTGEPLHIHQQKLLREARIAKSLTHPAFVPILDVLNENGTCYIVTEVVDGPRLTDISPPGEQWVVRLADHLLSAIEQTHEARITHHGIAPEKIVVRPDGTAKLTDFGFGVLTDDPVADMHALGKTLAFAIEERPGGGPLGQLITGLLERDPQLRLRPHRARMLVNEALSELPDDEGPPVNWGRRLRRTRRVTPPASSPVSPTVVDWSSVRRVGSGRYEFVRELGRGGMGVVWLARDTMLERDVAVKELMLPAGIPLEQRPTFQQRVLREARTAARLASPAVVTIFDLLTEDGETYIVMELIEAPTLDDFVDQFGPLRASAVARLAGELLSALELAHDAGIVHRDVKPSNVMVPAKGTAKLTDFGIAQEVTGTTRLTSVNEMMGSPAYMAPERLQDGEPAATWDLWALGATLFFAVEGSHAFDRSTAAATIAAVLSERVRVRSCHGPLAELIDGLLDPDPRTRHTRARARRLIQQALS